MKIGDTIKIKSTGRICKVVNQEENRTKLICEDIKGDIHYVYESEVDIISDNTFTI